MTQNLSAQPLAAAAAQALTELKPEQILITGAQGQLGTELRALLPQAYATDRRELDICQAAQVQHFVHDHDIKLIINCAAYTNVEQAESDRDACFQLNREGPQNLATCGCGLIHVSTDYVFSGCNSQPYTPEDPTTPVNIYGASKLAGEAAVLALNPNALIIRTSWLYSAHGKNFVKTIRTLSQERSELNVVCDQVGSPTWSHDLAQALVVAAAHYQGHGGIYHFSNEGVCSWYDLAHAIVHQCSAPHCKVLPIPASAYPTKAQRPYYSVLDKSKFAHTFNVLIPHWQESLELCLKQF